MRRPGNYCPARRSRCRTRSPAASSTPCAARRLLIRVWPAAEGAEAGRISQYLAGVPELLQRYRNASPGARALINAAIDARRLGHPLPIPHALLEQAAPGYLTDVEWNEAGEDWKGWLEQALDDTEKPSHGIFGPLTRIRPRPGEAHTTGPWYRLADYVEQTGRSERAGVFPPTTFW